jgi:hypothetical protein
MKRGRGQRPRPPTPPYVEFVRAVELAEAEAYARVNGNLVARSQFDTNAAMTWLRTRYPKDWPRHPGGVSDGQQPAPPPETPAAEVQTVGERVVYLPFDDLRPAVRQYLAERREAQRAADLGREPAAEPHPLDGDRLRRAGLRIDG